jgi:hypothetical protein
VEFRDCGIKAIKIYGGPVDDEDSSVEMENAGKLIIKNNTSFREDEEFKSYDKNDKYKGYDGNDKQLVMQEEDLEFVHDICFWMNGDALFEKCLLENDYMEYNSSLTL